MVAVLTNSKNSITVQRGGNFSSDDVVQAFHTTPKDRALSL